MEFKGKVALVTGAASGIGKAYCEELLRHGAKVSICDLDLDAGDELVEQLKEIHGQDSVIFCQCDVTDYPQFEESFQTTISTFGHLDIVINNAGVMNDRFWELQVDVNLNGVIRGTLLALRFLGRDQGGQGGVLVNTASSAYFRPQVSTPIYTATQHAVVGLTRAYGAAYHVERTGVRVLALCPGWTATGLVGDIRKQLMSAEYEQAWRADIAHQTQQKPEHVGKALLQILTNAKSGSAWLVENGQPAREMSFPGQ